MKTVFEYKKSLDAMRFTDAEKAAMTDRLLAARGTYARMWERYTPALSWGIGSEAQNGREVA